MRWARGRAAHRRGPRHPRQGRDLAQGRDRALGEVILALLPADPDRARQALPLHPRHQVEGAAEEDARSDPLRLRRGRHQVHLRRRHALLSDHHALERRWRETESDWAREEMARYFADIPCDACKGYRLKPEALCVRVGEKHIGEVAELSVKRAGEWFGELPKRLTPKQNEIAVRVLKEIRERLKFLVDVGLDYLTLARASGTLSGGESQRI